MWLFGCGWVGVVISLVLGYFGWFWVMGEQFLGFGGLGYWLV